LQKSIQQDIHSLIPAERLRHLHKVSARLSAAGSPHPPALAGCFVHLQAGDAVWPANYEAAAQIASGQKLSSTRDSGNASASFELVAELAKALREKSSSAVLVATLRERELLSPDAIALGRRIARQHLPLVLLSFGRTLPKPGDPQKRLDIPEMTVAADDAVAVYRVAEESFWRARTGVGPTWIRCATGAQH
jgi:hypothetical protein